MRRTAGKHALVFVVITVLVDIVAVASVGYFG